GDRVRDVPRRARHCELPGDRERKCELIEERVFAIERVKTTRGCEHQYSRGSELERRIRPEYQADADQANDAREPTRAAQHETYEPRAMGWQGRRCGEPLRHQAARDERALEHIEIAHASASRAHKRTSFISSRPLTVELAISQIES